MSSFNSLTLALEGWFDKQSVDLPSNLLDRVKTEFLPWSWDELSVTRRRLLALQLDFQCDPNAKQSRGAWSSRFKKMYALQRQIVQWQAVAAPTAIDLSLKESRLIELQRELGRMEMTERQVRGDYHPNRPLPVMPNEKPATIDASSTATRSTGGYLTYTKAMKSLADRLDATPEELAAWIFHGDLEAYLRVGEVDSPPRFHFSYGNDGNLEDYLTPLQACWFKEPAIDRFNPTRRFISGRNLIERWTTLLGSPPEALLHKQIREAKLVDWHPITVTTQDPDRFGSIQPLATGLFELAHVEAIEATNDFAAARDRDGLSVSRCPPASASQIKQHFRVIRDETENDKWWKRRMSEVERYGLVDCRVGKGKRGRGGSWWRPDLVAAWLVDRHDKGKAREGMSRGQARSALKNFPGCEDLADELFPNEE